MRIIGLCALAIAAWASVAPTFADDTTPPAATSDASPLQNAVRLTPAPELSLMVPHGWVACDPATNEQLGGNVLPTQFQQKLCDPTRPIHTLSKLVNPDLSEFVMVLVMELPAEQKAIFTSLPSESGDVQKSHLQALCNGVLSATAGRTCTANLGVVAGQQALIGEAQNNPQAGHSHVMGKFVVLTTSNHVYAVIFGSLETAKPEAAAIIDAMIASIETG